jgi:hypothetical protein
MTVLNLSGLSDDELANWHATFNTLWLQTQKELARRRQALQERDWAQEDADDANAGNCSRDRFA